MWPLLRLLVACMVKLPANEAASEPHGWLCKVRHFSRSVCWPSNSLERLASWNARMRRGCPCALKVQCITPRVLRCAELAPRETTEVSSGPHPRCQCTPLPVTWKLSITSGREALRRAQQPEQTTTSSLDARYPSAERGGAPRCRLRGRHPPAATLPPGAPRPLSRLAHDSGRLPRDTGGSL